MWGRPLVPVDEIARKENGWWEGNGVPWRARCPRPCLVGCCLRTRPAPCRAPSSFSSHASRPLPGGQTARGLRARQTPLLPACKRPRLHPARGTQTGERQEVMGADLGHCARHGATRWTYAILLEVALRNKQKRVSVPHRPESACVPGKRCRPRPCCELPPAPPPREGSGFHKSCVTRRLDSSSTPVRSLLLPTARWMVVRAAERGA